MNKSEKILVLEKEASNKIKVKGSQFIGYAKRISNAEEAKRELDRIKKEYFTATHHCYAYKTKKGDVKYSDDGEPNGTAGVRILNSINSFGLSEVIVIVIRYFGGTKLGVGPLGKAYDETSYNLLEIAEKNQLTRYSGIKITYGYDEINIVHYLLNKYKCRKIQNKYEDKPSIEALIEPFNIEKIESDLKEKTSNKARIQTSDNEYYLKS